MRRTHVLVLFLTVPGLIYLYVAMGSTENTKIKEIFSNRTFFSLGTTKKVDLRRSNYSRCTKYEVKSRTKLYDITKVTNLAPNTSARDVDLGDIPKIIWIMWDKGWDNAPPLNSACLRSWKRFNPNYKINEINLTEAERLIDRSHHFSDSIWTAESIQTKSDIIRIELLARHGGVWVDATTFCVQPLDDWLPQYADPAQLFMFERIDKDVKPEDAPWVSSWFIASSASSPIIQTWRDTTREMWAQTPSPKKRFDYYWFHRIFLHLVKTNAIFKDEFDKIPFVDSSTSHCFPEVHSCVNQTDLPLVMYKTTSYKCKDLREKIIALAKKKEL